MYMYTHGKSVLQHVHRILRYYDIALIIAKIFSVVYIVHVHEHLYVTVPCIPCLGLSLVATSNQPIMFIYTSYK